MVYLVMKTTDKMKVGTPKHSPSTIYIPIENEYKINKFKNK